MMDTPEPAHRRRERRGAAAVLVALVLWRNWVFLAWPLSYFDSDQAVFGLMARHIAELRAFPLFMYGQSYILAVEAWMAAPFFFLFGASAFLLKLPLLLVNLAVVLLLLHLLERDLGLRPWLAAVPALLFAIPAPGAAALLLDPSGGNLEPFLYVLLLWMARHRPNVSGLLLGVGFLHREFTIYGLAALLLIEAAQRTLFTRDGIVRRLTMLRAAAEVWIVAQLAKPLFSAAGPGTSVADLYGAPNNLQELANRTCVDPQTLLTGLGRYATTHLPRLFGATPMPLHEFAIESFATQGLPGAWVLLAATAGLAAVGIAAGLRGQGRSRQGLAFGGYLIAIGLLSMAGYIAGRCGDVAQGTMRYELLSIAGAVGLTATGLALAPSRGLRTSIVAATIACAALAASGHARLSAEYATGRPVGQKELLLRHLEARGVRYGYADYWTAYYVTFVTNERIVLASTDFVRIKPYQELVARQGDKAVRVSRHPCPGGRPLTPFYHLCPVQP